MRIKKKDAGIAASTNFTVPNNVPVITGRYAEAIDYIHSAIEALGEDAKNGDVIAKDSIVNLSVVLFDLKS